FHVRDRLRNGGADAHVVARVKSINRSGDTRHGVFIGGHSVKHKCGAQVFAIGGEAEALSAAPAKSGDEKFAVGGRNFQRVIGDGVQVGGDLVRIQMADGLGGFALRKGIGASA